MKKKLLEKDVFYLSLFICICVLAVGGILFTNSNLNKLTSSEKLASKDDEISLVKDNGKIPTSTNSKQNLEDAKNKKDKEEQVTNEEDSKQTKLNYIGTGVLREYSETMPTYSKTLDVWEIHKALDVSATEGAEVKSILDGKIASVYSDDRYGTCVEVDYNDGLKIIYSGLKEDVSLKKGDEVKQGDCIGHVGNTTTVENEDGTHVHIEAYKDNKAINPLGLLE